MLQIARLLGLATVAGLLAGCAAFPVGPSGKADVKEDLGRQEAVAAFERRRDEAQFAAARDRLEQGDVEAAEKLLAALVERSPAYADARLLLADLWVAQERTEEAEEQLRLILQSDAAHAQAHHSLGLLLDVTGRSEEAAGHFRRALELAPDNEVYRLSCQSQTEPGAYPAPPASAGTGDRTNSAPHS